MRTWGYVSILAIATACLADWEPARADDELVRVMTFNVRYGSANDGENSWPNRKEVLLDAIRNFDPDLLGTQETLAMQADFLAENLPALTLVGVGRDDGKRAGELSALMFKKVRFELVDSGTFWLSETPDKPGSKSWDSSLPRIATWARLRDKTSGGREICYLNTHWDHRGNKARVESAKIIRRWISEHAPHGVAIVTGDLNITDDHEGYRTLADDRQQPRLRDMYRLLYPEPGKDEATFHNFSGKRGGRRIDFIFASSEATPIASAIDYTNREGRYPSDHYPVTAVLRIDKPAAK